jgi:hypothetical protein
MPTPSKARKAHASMVNDAASGMKVSRLRVVGLMANLARPRHH